MARKEILCINKSNRSSEHEKIMNIGGKNPDGVRWKITQEKAIEYIENGTNSYFVSKNGKTTDVIVLKSSLGNKYIRTVKDSTTADNLLSLPECP